MKERAKIESLIKDNVDRFHISGDHPDFTSGVKYIIYLTDEIPISTKQYIDSSHFTKKNKQVNERLESGASELFKSLYNSLVCTLQKKQNS